MSTYINISKEVKKRLYFHHNIQIEGLQLFWFGLAFLVGVIFLFVFGVFLFWFGFLFYFVEESMQKEYFLLFISQVKMGTTL